MRKILFSIAAVSALAVGAPAAAQYSNGIYQDRSSGDYQTRGYGNGGVEVRVDQLQARLQAGVQSGLINSQEANRLYAQLQQLNQVERQYSRNGINLRERQDLQMRIRNLSQQIRYAEGRGNAGYGNGGYGQYDDRYNRQGRIDRNGDGYDDRTYDRNGRWSDRNRDGYDDRTYDRNGRWSDRNRDGYDARYSRQDRRDRDRDGYEDRDYDRDGRWDRDAQGGYQQPSQGILGGILGSIFGGNSGVRVGQRVPNGLYGLPSEYRRQFRDGNGVYYRTDGRNIYQVDARTQTVVRVYQMNR